MVPLYFRGVELHVVYHAKCHVFERLLPQEYPMSSPCMWPRLSDAGNPILVTAAEGDREFSRLVLEKVRILSALMPTAAKAAAKTKYLDVLGANGLKTGLWSNVLCAPVVSVGAVILPRSFPCSNVSSSISRAFVGAETDTSQFSGYQDEVTPEMKVASGDAVVHGPEKSMKSLYSRSKLIVVYCNFGNDLYQRWLFFGSMFVECTCALLNTLGLHSQSSAGLTLQDFTIDWPRLFVTRYVAQGCGNSLQLPLVGSYEVHNSGQEYREAKKDRVASLFFNRNSSPFVS